MAVVNLSVAGAIAWALMFVPALLLWHVSDWPPPRESLWFWLSDQWLAEGLAVLACLGAFSVAWRHWRRLPRAQMAWWSPWWIWLGWAACSLLWSIDRGESLRSLLAWSAYGLLTFTACSLVRSADDAYRWARRLGLIAVIVSLIGLGEYLWGSKASLAYMDQLDQAGRLKPYEGLWTTHVIRDFFLRKRISSVFGWPNLFAGFLLLMLPVTLALCRQSRTRPSRIWWAAATGLLGACFLGTLSMSGWLAAILTGCMVLLLRPARAPTTIGRRMASALGLGLALSAAMWLLGFALARPARPLMTASVKSRLVYLYGARHVVQARPLAGTGIGTFWIAYRSRMPQQTIPGQHGTMHAHNTLAEWAAELGLIGVVFLLAWVWRLWHFVSGPLRRQASSPLDRLQQGFAAGILGFFLHGLIEQTFFEPMLVPFWWLFIGLLAGIAGLDKPALGEPGRRMDSLAFRWLPVVASSVGMILVWRLAIADCWAARGEEFIGATRLAQAEAAFARAQRWDPLASRYPLRMGAVLLHGPETPEPEAQSPRGQSLQYLERAVRLSPWLSEAWMELGMARWKLGQADEAVEAMRRALYHDAASRAAASRLASLLRATGRFDELQALAQARQHVDAGDPKWLFLEAMARKELGRGK